MDNYIELAQRTKSDKFYGERVSLVDFRLAIGEVIAACNALDKIKKTLFYGKGQGTYSPNVNALATSVADTFATYEGATETFSLQRAHDVIHCLIGKATEAGEGLEALAKVMDGAPFDVTNFKEETGDGMWYDAIGLAAVGASISSAQWTNIEKLRTRFPDKFTEQNANERDLDAERSTLEDGAFTTRRKNNAL